MNILSPSMLSIDFNNMGENLKKVHNAGAKYIHVDVMDGMFVPNISFGPPVINFVRKAVPDAILDVHLMIEEPGRYIDDYKAAGADIMCVHAEACKHLHRTIQAIHNAGMKAAVALNPATPVEAIKYVIDDCDMVLVMSVNPGFGGQTFIPSALEKIREVKALAKERNLDLDIEVDGGVKLSNLKEVLDAGANVIVAGSAIFNNDIEKNVSDFLKIME
ncbi:MAG: ribulose-phosphate 3-epimerase [Eubacterium sp.]|nr:ribulose-phosphate 3-epimerase [Eubacterium sp.]